jgi:hypothetical protein
VQEGTIYPDPLLLGATKAKRNCGTFSTSATAFACWRMIRRESSATLDDAKAAAAVVAAELAADAGQYRGFEIHLTDEAGNDVARDPIEGQPQIQRIRPRRSRAKSRTYFCPVAW